MVCDTFLQKPVVKSKVPEKICKRLNTFDDFWGCRFVWHPEDTQNGPPPGGPVDFRSILARNGSGMDENQHNLVKTAQNFDASPAVTMGMRHDP